MDAGRPGGLLGRGPRLVAIVVLTLLVPALAGQRGWWAGPDVFSPPSFSQGIVVDELLFVGLTILGAGGGLALLVGLTVLVLTVRRRVADAVFVVVAVEGARLIGRLIKGIVGADRPVRFEAAGDLVPSIPEPAVMAVAVVVGAVALMATRRWPVTVAMALLAAMLAVEVASAAVMPLAHGADAFPSGHAVGSAALAVAVALLAARGTRWRRTTAVGAAGFAVGVGISRVYLGVHVPADVIAGWCVAIAWVLAVSVALLPGPEGMGARALPGRPGSRPGEQAPDGG